MSRFGLFSPRTKLWRFAGRLRHHCRDRARDRRRVRLVDTSHGDAAVHSEEDPELLCEALALRPREPGVAEHADLLNDVQPLLDRPTRLDEFALQQCPRLDGAGGRAVFGLGQC